MKARKSFVLALFILSVLCVDSHAMKATTVDGYCACFTESDLDDMTNFVVSNDRDSFNAYIKWEKCILLKPGLTVTVIKSPGLLGGKVQCVFQGVKFWTLREALKDYR